MSAAQQIKSGEADLIVAGGAESMTRAPWVMSKPGTPWAKPGDVVDTALGWRLINPRMRSIDGGDATMSLGECTEKLARLEGITREDADEFALRSQQAASASWESGLFADEIVAVQPAKGEAVTRDETVRGDTTREGLAKLKPSFSEVGVVTAGNASPLSDGASAIIVASGEAVKRHGLRPRARIVTSASAGVAPSLFGLGPVPAIRKALDRMGMSIADVGAVEINEAFAAQVIACERQLGLDRSRLNAAGGAIALGHPLGSSGVRITLTLLNRMARDDIQFGLSSLCIGVGQGAAMLVERV
jgi:acetyl-CoA acetyltransferase family protein